MLVKLGTTVGACVTVSTKLAVAGPPVPVAVSSIVVEVAFASSVPEITPPKRLKPEGKVEVLYTGDVTPEDLIVYEKGYPAWAVAVVALVMPTPEAGAEAPA